MKEQEKVKDLKPQYFLGFTLLVLFFPHSKRIFHFISLKMPNTEAKSQRSKHWCKVQIFLMSKFI